MKLIFWAFRQTWCFKVSLGNQGRKFLNSDGEFYLIWEQLVMSWKFDASKASWRLFLTQKAECNPIINYTPVTLFASPVWGSGVRPPLPSQHLFCCPLLRAGVHLPTHRPPRPSPVCCGASPVSRPGLAVPSCTARQLRPWSEWRAPKLFRHICRAATEPTAASTAGLTWPTTMSSSQR